VIGPKKVNLQPSAADATVWNRLSLEPSMSEIKKLVVPHGPEDLPVPAQLTALFENVAQEAGCYVFEHPEEHSFNAVFGGHQVTVSIVERK
jgi:hypothetical protein